MKYIVVKSNEVECVYWQFIRTSECELSAMHKWVTAECPARVDIAGGWSDTPPITYEQGGAVVNVAITVDGQVKLLIFLHACILWPLLPACQL